MNFKVIYFCIDIRSLIIYQDFKMFVSIVINLSFTKKKRSNEVQILLF